MHNVLVHKFVTQNECVAEVEAEARNLPAVNVKGTIQGEEFRPCSRKFKQWFDRRQNEQANG